MSEAPNPVGRPHAIDNFVLQELEGAFADGASDKTACFLAKISEATLYNYQNEHPEFLERKVELKNLTKYRAKKNIRKAIESGDVETSKWYAERKLKDEGFSPRTEVTGKDGEKLEAQPILVKFIGHETGTEDNRDTSGV